MAQRNQVAGFFRCHDACQSGHPQHIALFGGTGSNQLARGGLHGNQPLRHSHTVGGRLRPHVHHVGLTLGIEMGQR